MRRVCLALALAHAGCHRVTCEDWSGYGVQGEGCPPPDDTDLTCPADQPRLEGERSQSASALVLDAQSQSHFGIAIARTGSPEAPRGFAVGAPLRQSDESGLSIEDEDENGGVWLFGAGETWSTPGARDLDASVAGSDPDAVAWVGPANNVQLGWSLASGRFLDPDQWSLAAVAPEYEGDVEPGAIIILEDPGELDASRVVSNRLDTIIMGYDDGGLSLTALTVASVGDLQPDGGGDGFDVLAVSTQEPRLYSVAEGFVFLLLPPVDDGFELEDCTTSGSCVFWEDPMSWDSSSYGGFGASMVGVDFSAGGNTDLVVGAPTLAVDDFTWGAGAVHVVLGQDIPAEGGEIDNATDVLSWVGASPEGDTQGSGLGEALAAGDLDGDGYQDLAVGAPGADTVYVLYGSWMASVDGPSHPALSSFSDLGTWPRIEGARGGEDEEFGFSLAVPGDLDRDCNDDLAVGAPRVDDLVGEIWLIYGPVSGAVEVSSKDERSAVLTRGSEDSGSLGTVLVAPGDLDQDGSPDLLVGSTRLDGASGGVTLWRMIGE